MVSVYKTWNSSEFTRIKIAASSLYPTFKVKFLPRPEIKLAENHEGDRISVAVWLQRLSFYSSNNYITLHNLTTRVKSRTTFSGFFCDSGFSKKKTFFSMEIHR